LPPEPHSAANQIAARCQLGMTLFTRRRVGRRDRLCDDTKQAQLARACAKIRLLWLAENTFEQHLGGFGIGDPAPFAASTIAVDGPLHRQGLCSPNARFKPELGEA